MSTFTNMSGVPLSVAVYLATDNYDYDPTAISATTLLQATRKTVLSSRVPAEMNVTDILSVVKSRTGTAIHDSIESAWKNNYPGAMKRLGYSQDIIDRIRINPDQETVKDNDIPVYMEQRVSRMIGGRKLSGKYDFVAEGRVQDFKTTTVFTWINRTKDDDYKLQGSIYRWLNPKIITDDVMAIQFLFTDWMPGRAANEAKYPNRPVEQLLIPLLSLEDTEQYILNKLNEIEQYKDAPQSAIPFCTDKDLWRSESEYKYYKNPEKRARSTKNFDQDHAAALRYQAEQGGVGIVVEIPGRVIACRYCKAFPVCEQKDIYLADGSLQLS